MESLEERLQRETREKVYNLVKEVHIQKPFEDVTGEPHYVTNEIMKIISHTISETIKAGVSVIEGEEKVYFESIQPTWIDEEPAWTLVAIKGNKVVWCSEKPVKQSTIASAYYKETGTYASLVITIGEVEKGTKHIYEKTLQTAVTKLQELGK